MNYKNDKNVKNFDTNYKNNIDNDNDNNDDKM